VKSRPRWARLAAVLAAVSLVALTPVSAHADGYVPIFGRS
jgi:hypothetical protein